MKDLVVLITGASKGIGLATAAYLAKDGYTVFATARSPEKHPALLKLSELYPNLTVEKLDVTDSEANINAVVDKIGKIDILINNAGIGLAGVAESCSLDQIKRVIDTNILGVIKVTNAVLPGMRKSNSGLILTISSIVGPLPDMKQPFYSGSKAMLEHYTAVLKNDLAEAKYNIRVANVHPGPVITNFEAATQTGDRFHDKANPYPQMHDSIKEWRALMKKGRPIEETVDTIVSVIRADNPAFWNPTEARVKENFARVYVDETGHIFSQGPFFTPKESVASTSSAKSESAAPPVSSLMSGIRSKL